MILHVFMCFQRCWLFFRRYGGNHHWYLVGHEAHSHSWRRNQSLASSMCFFLLLFARLDAQIFVFIRNGRCCNFLIAKITPSCSYPLQVKHDDGLYISRTQKVISEIFLTRLLTTKVRVTWMELIHPGFQKQSGNSGSAESVLMYGVASDQIKNSSDKWYFFSCRAPSNST